MEVSAKTKTRGRCDCCGRHVKCLWPINLQDMCIKCTKVAQQLGHGIEWGRVVNPHKLLTFEPRLYVRLPNIGGVKRVASPAY